MRNGLPRRRDVGLREEQPAEPDFDVVGVIQARDVVQLRKTPSKVRDPAGNSHRLGHFVSPPVVWDRAWSKNS